LYENHKIFFGSRWERLGAQIDRKYFRKFIGRIFATAVANILRLKVYDTQCGAKLFRAEIVELLFSEKFVSKWFFDVELLYRYQLAVGKKVLMANVVEVPLRTWNHISGSKLKFKDFVSAPFELFKIYRFYKNRNK
jgi:dolichyl-phosphate beta-glucosyltransferase